MSLGAMAYPDDEFDEGFCHEDEPSFEWLLEENMPLLRTIVRLHMDPVIREFESWLETAEAIRVDLLRTGTWFARYGRAEFRSWFIVQVHDRLVLRMRYYYAYKRRPGLLERFCRNGARPHQDAAGLPSPRLKDLLDQHLPGLLAFVRQGMERTPLAKVSCVEIVQSICDEYLQQSQTFEDRGDLLFRTGLYRRALRKLAEHQRRHRSLHAEGSPAAAPAPTAESTLPLRPTAAASTVRAKSKFSSQEMDRLFARYCPEGSDLEDDETYDRFREATEQLCSLYQRMLHLSCIEGKSESQIAQCTGYRLDAIKKLLQRAHSSLHHLLETP